MANLAAMNDEICIPTYIINLPKRTDRLTHVLSQFEGKAEFDIHVIEAVEHPTGAVGLWHSICKVVKIAIEKQEDVIILCEDDHEFTSGYDREKFIGAIYEAHRLNANFLLGGINGGFKNGLLLPTGLFWLDAFWGTHFVVVFSNFYEAILNEPFSDQDAADLKFTEMTSNKFVLYPMISKQKGFGYSDITGSDNTDTHLQYLYRSAVLRMDKIHSANQEALYYQNQKSKI